MAARGLRRERTPIPRASPATPDFRHQATALGTRQHRSAAAASSQRALRMVAGALAAARWLQIAALLTKAQADRRRGRASRPIRGAARWAEYRYQRFIGFAACRAISLDRPQPGDRGLALVALFPFVALLALVAFFPLVAGLALRPLRSLRTGLALSARHALNALRTLRPD